MALDVEAIIADLRAEADRWNVKSMVPGIGDDLRRRYRKLHEELRRLANKYEGARETQVPPPDPTALIIAWLRSDPANVDPICGDNYVARDIADAIEEGRHLRRDTAPCLDNPKTDPPPSNTELRDGRPCPHCGALLAPWKAEGISLRCPCCSEIVRAATRPQD